MHKYLPSKKFILILASIIIAVGIIYLPTLFKKIQKANDQSEKTLNNGAQEFTNLDSDNDGMKDWEENLWGTNPNNFDTDRDGTGDGDELRISRNPLKTNTALANQAPNDGLATEVINAQKKAVESFNSLNTTEKVSRELLSQYIKAKNTNSSLSEVEIRAIVDNALLFLPKITFKTYTSKDLTISYSNDADTLRNYANEIARVIIENMKTKTESVDSIIAATSDITDTSKLTEETKIIFKRFDPLIAKNKKTVSDLLKISVPNVFINEHLSLLNSFEEIYEKLDLMQKSAEDIIILALIETHYYQSVESLATALVKMTGKVFDTKVTFLSKSDYGYAFFNVIMSKN